jgi:hypothetical protein
MDPTDTGAPGPRPLRRREFLVGTLAAAAGTFALGAPPVAMAAATTTDLRRIIDLGAGGALYPGSVGDLRYHGNIEHLLETGTSWVRLWADWPSLQPDPAYALDDPSNPGAPWLQALDEQIAAACAAGLRVVLTAYRFPLWANGTAALGAQLGTDAEIGFDPWDRMSPATWARYVAAGRDPTKDTPGRRGLEFRIPPDGLGIDSPWGAFFEALYARYHAGRRSSGRWVGGFELTNEPAHQWWPKYAPSPTADPFALGAPVLPAAFAQAMQTAQAVAHRHGNTTRLLAPSVADVADSSRNVMGYPEFIANLLNALDALGFRPSRRMTWSHHNYLDLEQRKADTSVQRVRAMLAGRWQGAQSDGGATVWITESGARLSNMRRFYPTEDPLQAQLRCWQLAWERFSRADGPGAGVGMIGQYTLHADPSFDSGLLEPWPSEVHRPSYDYWTTLPRLA